MMVGLDASGNEGIGDSGVGKGQWKDGHVLTFWAYGYQYPGTTPYHVYYTQMDRTNTTNQIQRFTLSSYKQEDEEGVKNGWTMGFSFWAFEDQFVTRYKGIVGSI